ncbi:hypothetical protein ABPG72_020078 [Tetrahymena utriculariae]
MLHFTESDSKPTFSSYIRQKLTHRCSAQPKSFKFIRETEQCSYDSIIEIIQHQQSFTIENLEQLYTDLLTIKVNKRGTYKPSHIDISLYQLEMSNRMYSIIDSWVTNNGTQLSEQFKREIQTSPNPAINQEQISNHLIRIITQQSNDILSFFNVLLSIITQLTHHQNIWQFDQNNNYQFITQSYHVSKQLNDINYSIVRQVIQKIQLSIQYITQEEQEQKDIDQSLLISKSIFQSIELILNKLSTFDSWDSIYQNLIAIISDQRISQPKLQPSSLEIPGQQISKQQQQSKYLLGWFPNDYNQSTHQDILDHIQGINRQLIYDYIYGSKLQGQKLYKIQMFPSLQQSYLDKMKNLMIKLDIQINNDTIIIFTDASVHSESSGGIILFNNKNFGPWHVQGNIGDNKKINLN